MRDQQAFLEEAGGMLSRGADIEDVLRVLRVNGFSKVHSIKALVDLGYATMGEAKVVVHNSSTWADVRNRDEEFHKTLE